MSGWQRFCYGLGAGGGAALSAMTGFMLVFCTNVLHIDPAIAGTVLAASRVLDGISDLLAGRIIDRTHSRFGKARPWLLRMILPTMICLIAAFCVPSSLSTVGQIVYVFITYNLLSTACYTMVAVSYSSMSSLITTNQYERGINGVVSMTMSTVFSLVLNAVILKMCAAFGGGETYAPQGWRISAVIVAVAFALCVLIAFAFCREIEPTAKDQEHGEKKRTASVWVTLKALVTNKYWVQYVIALVSNTMGNTFITGVSLFYAQFVLGDEQIYSTLAVALMVPMFLGVVVTALLIKRFGKRNTALFGLSVLAIGTILSGILPDTTTCAVITLAVRGFGAGFPSAIGNAVLQDTLTYGKWRSGFDMVGMGNAACSFSNKVGSGLGTALVGWILAWGGYDSYATVQSAAAQNTIKLSFSWLPIFFVIVTIVCFVFYRLDKEYATYEKDLSEGRYGPDAIKLEE
jgi:GPH family glycoside/pentoside/hexuronide:cation symporter